MVDRLVLEQLRDVHAAEIPGLESEVVVRELARIWRRC